jgi:nucleotide-binding universal stress UspA family protein
MRRAHSSGGPFEDIENEDTMIAMKNVLVATDFSPVSETALTYGRALAAAFGATLHVLHVVENLAVRLSYADAVGFSSAELQADLEEAGKRQLAALASDGNRGGLLVITELRVGTNIAQEICDYAKDAAVDAIVIGATGRGAIDRMLLGSVADKVIRRAPCPVLAVRHPEREFVLADPPRSDVATAPVAPGL